MERSEIPLSSLPHVSSSHPFSSFECLLYLAYMADVPEFAKRISVRHGHWVWWHILRGSVAIRLQPGNEPEIVVGHGGSVLLPAGLARSHSFSDDAKILSLHFTASGAAGRSLIRTGGIVAWAPGEVSELVASAHSVLEHLPEKTGRLFTQGAESELAPVISAYAAMWRFIAALIAALLFKGMEAGVFAPLDARLERLLDEMRQSPRAGPLPFDRWSRLSGLGRSQLDRLCRAQYGRSLRTHRDAILLARLEREFALGLRPIKETAFVFGFTDASHLTRWFRMHSGVTPGNFRRSMQPGTL